MEQDSETMTVLVVEDEPMVLNAIVTILKFLGYEVLTATNTQEAMETFNAQPEHIDIVLTDNVWRGKAEDPLPQQIKAKSPHTAVVIVSGNNELLEPLHMANLHLAKPVSVATLKDVLQRLRTQRNDEMPFFNPRSRMLVVIETDWLKLEASRERLEQAGYKVAGFTSSEEALDQFEQLLARDESLVVMIIEKEPDLRTQIGRAVKEHSPKTPIILVSDYGNSHGLPEDVEWGISWPFRIPNIDEAIEFFNKNAG